MKYQPSTVRLNSTAFVSPTKTYSRRSIPSSSVSPGIMDSSVDSGFAPLDPPNPFVGAGGEDDKDGTSFMSTGPGDLPFVVGEIPGTTFSISLLLKLNLLGGIIALGSSTSGGIMLWCSGTYPLPLAPKSVATVGEGVRGRGNFDLTTAVLEKNSWKVARSMGLRLSSILMSCLTSSGTGFSLGSGS